MQVKGCPSALQHSVQVPSTPSAHFNLSSNIMQGVNEASHAEKQARLFHTQVREAWQCAGVLRMVRSLHPLGKGESATQHTRVTAESTGGSKTSLSDTPSPFFLLLSDWSTDQLHHPPPRCMT